MTYTVFGGELSLFTCKLEAAMRFYGADFELQAKTPDNAQNIEMRAGTHQVPVLLTPENWMIADTTPLMRLLDARFPDRAMFPPGYAGFVVQLLEEHFDEWVARVMVHYRWHYPASAEFASLRMAGERNPEVASRVREWGPRACRATGTAEVSQQRAAEQEYERILEAAERQLKDTAFLLGDRPTALDCIVLGGLRAHTNMDPDPKKVVAAYPTVVAWAETRADTWDGSGELAAEALTPFAEHVLGEMGSTYRPYILANREAQQAGAKACQAHTYGETVSYLSRPYPEQSRRMVSAGLEALASADRVKADTLLERFGLADTF